ncbi:MAG: TetR family transcriptional regulator [Actinomycetota bacterium]|nr:TetR family transcriptional regulator [Actinomycetota bacterium]
MAHARTAHARTRRRPDTVAATRSERKQRTREALIDAAFRLLEQESFSSLSLREVAREAGIVPTGFYRHFENMHGLGLALVDRSFRSLRDMLRDARATADGHEHMVRRSIAILVADVHEHRAHFRFIARERCGGVASLRHAIRSQIRLLASELATDLARLPALASWSTDDLHMLAAMLVDVGVSAADALVDLGPGEEEAEREIASVAERQLRLVTLGAAAWLSGGGAIG